MIGVDTNVLARLIVRDDVVQLESARRFFSQRSRSDPAVVSLVVIAELVWLLRNPYSFSLHQIADAVAALLASDDFLIERGAYVEEAVALARERRVDISDYLIAAVATDLGATSTATFDKGAAKRVPGMVLLK